MWIFCWLLMLITCCDYLYYFLLCLGLYAYLCLVLFLQAAAARRFRSQTGGFHDRRRG